MRSPAPADDAAPVTAAAPTTTPPATAEVEAPEATDDDPAPQPSDEAAPADDAAPATAAPATAAPIEVPEKLQHVGENVTGGELDLSVYAGRDTIAWFWAPW